MSRTKLFVSCLAISVLCLPEGVLARGGRGGGGGGAARPSVGRSPSMSRPAQPAARPAPSRPAPAPRPATPAKRPAVTDRPNGNARPGGATRPSGGVAQAKRPSSSQLNDFLNLPSQGGSRPAQLPAKVPTKLPAQLPTTRPGTGGGAVADVLQRPAAIPPRVKIGDNVNLNQTLIQNRVGNFTPRQRDLQQAGDKLRDRLGDHYDHDHLCDDFWSHHHHAHYHFHQHPVYWSWCTWSAMNTFLPWRWGTPLYYDYGAGGNVVYEGDTVVVNNQTYPADAYNEEAEKLAKSAPEVADPDAMEWLPLGVFALTKDGESDAVPNMFLQLAVSKEGILAGTYQNKSTDTTESLEGMVDQKSQRAAWTIVDKNTPIVETGIYNLTQNESRCLVHFADGSTQNWLLVRIEGPKPDEKAASEAK